MIRNESWGISFAIFMREANEEKLADYRRYSVELNGTMDLKRRYLTLP